MNFAKNSHFCEVRRKNEPNLIILPPLLERYFYTQNQRKRGKAMEPEKRTPEEEKKPDAPATEQKDEPKPEEKPADNKQADDNSTADKPDESKADDKKDDKPEEKVNKPEPAPEAPAVPDAKDEEILRLTFNHFFLCGYSDCTHG